MKVNTSKSKNAESFYIKQSYIDSNGKSTSRTIRKLGTLEELLKEHGPTRDDVMKWAREQARIETEKYEQEKENHCLPVIFHPNRKIPYGERRKFDGGCNRFTTNSGCLPSVGKSVKSITMSTILTRSFPTWSIPGSLTPEASAHPTKPPGSSSNLQCMSCMMYTGH